MTKVTKYRIQWENESGIQSAFFWLPEGETPKGNLKALLNLVELDASEFGYAYTLEAFNDTIGVYQKVVG